MANGLLDNYLLPPEVQRDANIRGILGTLIGIGQASGPSPVPVGLGTIASSGAAAGLKAMDDYEQGQFKKAYIGAQVGKLKEATEQKQRVLQYAQSLPPGEERDRLMLEIQGINSNRIKGDRPWYAISPENAQTAANFEALKGWATLGPDTAKSAAQTRIVAGADGRIQGFGPPYQGGIGAVMDSLGLPGLLSGGLPPSPGSTMRPPPINIPQQQSPLAMADTAGPANASAGVQMAQAQGGFRPGGTQLAPPSVSPGTVFQQQMTPETSFSKKRGDAFGDMYTKMLNRSMEIGGERQKLGRLDMLLDQVYTGTGGNVVDSAKRAAQALGIDLGPVGPGEAANALANEFALTLRNPNSGAGMPGAMSDADRDFLRSMVPSLANSKEGRKLMLETRGKMLDREQEIGRMAREYVKKNKGQLDEGFLDQLEQWSAKNPLFTDDDRKRLEKLSGAPAQNNDPLGLFR